MPKQIGKKVSIILLSVIVFILLLDLLDTPVSCWLTGRLYQVEVVAPSWFSPTAQQSIFGHFYVVGDSVYYTTRLTLSNHSSEGKRFTLMIFSPFDVVTGLLADPKAYAVDEDGNPRFFTLAANQTSTFHEVLFKGKGAGGSTKWDRFLPTVFVKEIDAIDQAETDDWDGEGDIYQSISPTPRAAD